MFSKHFKFCRCDIEQNPRLKENYRIYELPTFLFFNKGEMKNLIQGIVSENELVSNIQNFKKTVDIEGHSPKTSIHEEAEKIDKCQNKFLALNLTCSQRNQLLSQ